MSAILFLKNTLPNPYRQMVFMIKDFPLRDKKVVLHVRRRRWVDDAGKSYSRCWDLVAEGTRYSKEFAFFLKGAFGYLPDTSPIS
jgi:transposase